MIKRIFSFKGFTLLELLFVVAILATIATFGLSTYRQRTLNVRVARTALEIQQIMQAASSFFVVKDAWPSKSKNTMPDFKKDYLPFGGAQNASPFGFPYEYEATNDNNPKVGLFEVSTQVPTENVAQRIAARLPNGKAISDSDKNKFIVTSQVTAPGQERPTEGIIIKEIGYKVATKDNHFFKKDDFNCQAGLEPAMAVSIARLNMKNDDPQTFAPISINRLRLGTASQSEEVTCDASSCSFNVFLSGTAGKGENQKGNWFNNINVTVQYIAYCKPKKNS